MAQGLVRRRVRDRPAPAGSVRSSPKEVLGSWSLVMMAFLPIPASRGPAARPRI